MIANAARYHQSGWDTDLAKPFNRLESLSPIVERTGHWWLFRANEGHQEYRIHCQLTSLSLREHQKGSAPKGRHRFKLLGNVWEPSDWVIVVRDLSIALHRAREAGAHHVDISAYLNRIEDLRRKTAIIGLHDVLTSSPLQAAALNYLRGATGLIAPWSLNLSGPFRIFTASQNPPFGMRAVWRGEKLPPPFEFIPFTVRVHLGEDGFLNGISGPSIDASEPVHRMSVVDELKALGELSEMGLSEVGCVALEAFARSFSPA